FELESGAVSDAVRTANGYVILTVTGSEPSRLPELDEVRTRVEADLRRERTQSLAAERAAAVAPGLKSAANFRAAAAASGLSVRTTGRFTRGSSIPEVGSSVAVDTAAFSLPVGAGSDPVATNHGAVIIRVVERPQVDAEEMAAAREQLRQELASQRRAQFFASYMTKAKERMQISVDRAVLSRLTT